MNDLIERLRDENPVPACPPPSLDDVWRKLDAEAQAPAAAVAPRRRRPEWLVVALGAVPVVAIVLLAVLALRGATPSTPARGVGTAPAIVHYVATGVESFQGSVTRAQMIRATSTRWVVWVSGSRTHVEIYRANGELIGEIASTPTRIQEYVPPPRGNVILTGPPPKGRAMCNTLLTICALRGVDPVALVRKFKRIGTLRFAHSTMLDGRTLALYEGRSGDMQMGVWVDPSTSIPFQIRTRVPLLQRKPGWMVTTIRITGYERLPLNAKSEVLLRLRAHRNAPVVCRVFEPDNSAGNC